MKIRKRITALLLSAMMITGIAAHNVSAANKDTAPLKALTGLEPVAAQPINADLEATLENLPEKYNSALEGYVLPVRTQQDNTCWAFGALSTFETVLIKNGEDISTFAPQHANFWGTKRDDGTGWQRGEYDGGYSYIPLGYLTSWSGPVYESDFPEYSGKADYESFSKAPEYVLTEAVFFDSSTDRDAIKELIYTYGAVVGNYNANSQYLSNRTSYYCNNSSFTISQLSGHCVSVVGWDDSYAKENFLNSLSGMPENNGAWLIKNSWGENSNSLGGYYWVSYEDVWMFDDIFGPSYAFTNYEKLTDNNKIYQNEVDGATYEFTYLTEEKNTPYNEITYMNVFDFEKEHRFLDKVVFETTSLGSDYTVYYIPLIEGVPASNTEFWTKLSEGTVDYTGYICVDMENILLPEGKAAIGITLDNERAYLENKGSKYIHNSIGVDEWLFSNKKYIFYPQSEYGMSYYMQDGVVYDVMDFYENEFRDNIGGTFVIKAITSNYETPTEPDSSTAPETSLPADTSINTDPTETETTPTETTVNTDPTETETTETTIPTETVTDKTEPSSTAPTYTSGDFSEPLVYLVGDSDLSGKVNVKDATLVQKHAASLLTLTGTAAYAADSNEDGKINVVDATEIQKFVAGIEIRSRVGTQIIFFE